MITHLSLGETNYSRTKTLQQLISVNTICFGGNRKLKIYGLLHCKSGKRMKPTNRVFFSSATEAEKNGYRPCGHCMKDEYNIWKYKNL
jgi:methylphosphotriester-DNA--protein-cysteine methyltransferase